MLWHMKSTNWFMNTHKVQIKVPLQNVQHTIYRPDPTPIEIKSRAGWRFSFKTFFDEKLLLEIFQACFFSLPSFQWKPRLLFSKFSFFHHRSSQNMVFRLLVSHRAFPGGLYSSFCHLSVFKLWGLQLVVGFSDVFSDQLNQKPKPFSSFRVALMASGLTWQAFLSSKFNLVQISRQPQTNKVKNVQEDTTNLQSNLKRSEQIWRNWNQGEAFWC